MPINSGLGAAVIFEQPKLRVTLDAGIRLFDEKLTLGTRIVDVSKTVPALGSLRSGYEMPGYRVYDIYGSYSLRRSDQAALRREQRHRPLLMRRRSAPISTPRRAVPRRCR